MSVVRHAHGCSSWNWSWPRGWGLCPPPHFIYDSDFIWKSPGKGKVYPLQEDTSHENMGGSYIDVHLWSLIRASQSLVKIHSENSIGVQSGLLFLKDQDSDDKLIGGEKIKFIQGLEFLVGEGLRTAKGRREKDLRQEG